MHTRVQTAHCHSHLSLSPEKLSFHSKGCAFCVFPKSHSSNGDANSLCKSTFLRAANQAPTIVACACTYRHDPSHPPPNPGMTPSPGLLTFQMHSPRSPAHSSNHLPGTLSSLTQYPAPSHPRAMPIYSPHVFQGHFSVLFLLCCPPATSGPLGPGLSHLLAKKAPTVTRAPSATAPVSTVLTEAQFPSRRRRASSRAPSPYRAVNSAQPPLLWIQSASRVSR